MRIKFGIFLAISGFIHQIKCTNVPYSDMYLPEGTNGFVCGTDLFTIDHLRKVVKKAMESAFFEDYYNKFPTLFEDTHLFNVKSDILLSWPTMLNEKLFYSHPGKIRIIINTRGQIMGLVTISPNDNQQKINYEKCNPVYRSLGGENDERGISDESISKPRLGYSCGLIVILWSEVGRTMEIISDDYFQSRVISKDKLTSFKKYTGNEFVGVDLYSFPIHRNPVSKYLKGTPGVLRIVFDRRNSEVKGIINIQDRNIKCVAVWDLSSTPSSSIYNPSSILDLEIIQDNFWPETCFGHKIKAKTIWLYLEFASQNWMSKKLKIPVNMRDILFLKSTNLTNLAFNSLFAIGHDTRLGTYSLYYVNVQNGGLVKPRACLEFSHDIIRHLQRIHGQVTES
ncbi:CSEP0247 putative effector protein [Blumeria hordei DH14]|uniref:CSEP0247 putative effector protein n=1 Tax=Blumeria graminis f. sp. hordei (strain DH14) TaxID=546991 RepID=N1JGZ5_BLUG1|nr:CSEP0247 putative effector protein [Blumeria hordei DH14]